MTNWPENKEQSAAILTIKDAGNMTKKDRRAIANWLRQSADNLEIYGEEYSSTFRARYLY